MRLRRLALVASALFCVAALIGIPYAIFVPQVFIKDVRREIDAALPPGSSPAKVMHWLSSHRSIQYSGHVVGDTSQDIVQISALIKDSGPLWETPETLEIDFSFENDGLQRVTIKRHHTPFVWPF